MCLLKFSQEVISLEQAHCFHCVCVDFLRMAMNFEESRKKWLQTAEELVSCNEVLAKAETEKGALEVKLKHARNQVDVEIRRRQKAEAVYEKLVSAKTHTKCQCHHTLTKLWNPLVAVTLFPK